MRNNKSACLSVSITENRLICCHTAVVTDKQVVLCVRIAWALGGGSTLYVEEESDAIPLHKPEAEESVCYEVLVSISKNCF